MSDGVGGITELQLLEAEATMLERQLDGVNRAGSASEACARVIASIRAAEEGDGFVGAAASASGEHNQYHSSAGSEGDGCCAVL